MIKGSKWILWLCSDPHDGPFPRYDCPPSLLATDPPDLLRTVHDLHAAAELARARFEDTWGGSKSLSKCYG